MDEGGMLGKTQWLVLHSTVTHTKMDHYRTQNLEGKSPVPNELSKSKVGYLDNRW